jgi:dihydroxyacetone kinase-like protein
MKPRGVAGVSLLYKILGGAAHDNKNLDYVHELGERVLSNMSTFGVSMDCCSLPGKPKSHSLADDEIEIGMGIHGEPGREIVKWMPIKKLVDQLLTDLKK